MNLEARTNEQLRNHNNLNFYDAQIQYLDYRKEHNELVASGEVTESQLQCYFIMCKYIPHKYHGEKE
jgi:hypothetical protein